LADADDDVADNEEAYGTKLAGYSVVSAVGDLPSSSIA